MRTAGALADIVSLNFNNAAGAIGPAGIGSSTAEATEEKVGWIREGAAERLDDVELEIAAYFTNVTDSSDAATAGMAGALGLSVEEMADHPHALIGSKDELVERLGARRDRYGISYVTVPAQVMAGFAPVVAALNGR